MSSINSGGRERAARAGGSGWQRTACIAALASALAACGGGGGGGSTSAPTTGGDTTTTTPPAVDTVNRALLIDLDGVTYSALQAGIADGSLPNLAKLQVQLAYSGGPANASQANLDAPAWATLLTGTWAARNQVNNASGQTSQAPTIFDIQRAADSASKTGVAAASAGLAQLLSQQQGDGALSTLTNCSQDAQVESCVTNKAMQMIDGGYATVVAQYHSAEDAASNYGVNSAQYVTQLRQLDAYVGTLVSEAAKSPGWLVAVTASHGLNAAGGSDGLNLLPEATTFVALNQAANNGTAGVNAAVPSALSGLFAYEGTTDVVPTMLSWLNQLPAAAGYALDGAQLVNAQGVAQLTSSVSNDNSYSAAVVLNWSAPAGAAITVFRDGQQVAVLPAGTTSYTDASISQDAKVTGTGAFNLNYVVEAGTAPRAVLVPVHYKAPVPLAATVLQGLASYYPFNTLAQLPAAPVDALCASGSGSAPCATPATAMSEFASGETNNVSAVSDPFGGSRALMVDDTLADTTDASNYTGYKLTPAAPASANDVVAAAVANVQANPASANGAFTIGFWYKGGCPPVAADAAPVFGNKTNYGTSGGTAGVIFATWQSSGGCGFDINIADGTNSNKNRVDTDSATIGSAGSAYQAFQPNQWVYVAAVVNLSSAALTAVDGTSVPAYSMTGYVFSPNNGTPAVQRIFSSLVTQATNPWSVAGLVGTGVYGLGEDGSGLYYSAGATKGPVPHSFADLAMWNRALGASELQSIYQSVRPLSSLMTPSP